jgi:hypothetical protein
MGLLFQELRIENSFKNFFLTLTKGNLGVAVKDWLTTSQVVAPSGWVPGLIMVVPCRKHAAAYEGTKAQQLGKGDVAYLHSMIR